MRPPFIVGYIIVAVFVIFALIQGNYEFVIYAGVTAVLLGMIHLTDKKVNYNKWVLWGFDIWIVSHILGGMLWIGDKVLYNVILLPIVGEPYLILKYDQVIHTFCYLVIALLVWSIVTKYSKKTGFGILAFITVMAATGIGGLNEIVEFGTTIFFDNNVGGYENTAIDIVSNLVGALLAVPLMKLITQKNI